MLGAPPAPIVRSTSTPSHRCTDQPLNADRAPRWTGATPSRTGAIGAAELYLTESVPTPSRPAESGFNLGAVYLSSGVSMVTKRIWRSYLSILPRRTSYIQNYVSPDLSRALNVCSGHAIAFVSIRSYNVKRKHSTGRHNIPRPWDLTDPVRQLQIPHIYTKPERRP